VTKCRDQSHASQEDEEGHQKFLSGCFQSRRQNDMTHQADITD